MAEDDVDLSDHMLLLRDLAADKPQPILFSSNIYDKVSVASSYCHMTFTFIFFGFRTANCAYKAIGRPYIFEVNVSY